MPIIGITGLAGSGKDTLAEGFMAYGYMRWRFADPLKAMLRAMLAFSGEPASKIEAMVNDRLKETPSPLLCGQTPRHAMQTLGTEWRNMIGSDLWNNIMRERLRKRAPGSSIVIPDMRFPREVALLREFGGHLIRVTRAGVPQGSHASEIYISELPVDLEIANDGSKAGLQAKALNALHTLGIAP